MIHALLLFAALLAAPQRAHGYWDEWGGYHAPEKCDVGPCETISRKESRRCGCYYVGLDPDVARQRRSHR